MATGSKTLPKTFHCSVVTPERVVLDCDARFVALPAHDGEIGLLRGRAPIVCKLAIGRLRVETAEGEQAFYIDGGFAEMAENDLTVLTEDAKSAEELDRAAAEEALAVAKALDTGDEHAQREKEKAIARARVQLRMLARA